MSAAAMNVPATIPVRAVPLLLYDGGCQTCARIAHWVHNAAAGPGGPAIIDRPVGNDPAALLLLNPGLDIWDAYAVSHVIMPDGSMRLGGEAVAEVFRCLPAMKWAAACCDISIGGVRPFQLLLNLAYHILDDIRPILGCESCGHSKAWVRPLARLMKRLRGRAAPPGLPVHFKPLP